MSITWQGKLVLIGIVGFLAYSAIASGASGREVERRVALGACGLATDYVSWRLDFESDMGAVTRIEGKALDTYVNESKLYARASERLMGQVSGAAYTVMSRLNQMATHDARRSESTLASADRFVDAYVNNCL